MSENIFRREILVNVGIKDVSHDLTKKKVSL
jgi:hypothetical protein